MNVSAIVVTRGDVDIQPIIDSLPRDWEIVIWENGHTVTRSDGYAEVAPDYAVYGRYAAIEHASHELIYVQDDDCIVSDPQAIVSVINPHGDLTRRNFVVCNMPLEFRHDFYQEQALVGFGAAFHRDAPARAFRRYWERYYGAPEPDGSHADHVMFNRVCDVVFTALTPRVLVDIPKENLEHAYAENRMYRQVQHVGERTAALLAARKVMEAETAHA